MALREIRTMSKQIAQMQSTINALTASRTRRVTISDYARENNLSNGCVRKRIFRGVLNAEKIGNMYYIVLPA